LADEIPPADAAEPEAAIAAPEPEPEPIDPLASLDASTRELLERIDAALGDAVVARGAAKRELVVRVRPQSWGQVATVAKHQLDCDYLTFVAGIDWLPAPLVGGDDAATDTSAPVQPREQTYGVTGSEGRFQVFARVQSTSRHWGVTFKTDVDETAPLVESWTSVYPGADWHERETWEMYGISFAGHPAIRHLYLPFDFEGNPLRKDFPLLAREVKPWPGLVDVEPMPPDDGAVAVAPPPDDGAVAVAPPPDDGADAGAPPPADGAVPPADGGDA
jgi:NADH-quinone oxidoreductase subunit C